MSHQIQPPSFAYDSLEPFIDQATMDLHVNKHHQGYADKLNAALSAHSHLQSLPIEKLLVNDLGLNTQNSTLIRNMAGGVLNHNFFWSILSAPKQQEPPSWFTPELKTDFTQAATSLFGSGWAWIVQDTNGPTVITTPNQDNPIAQNLTPLLGIDLWEHAYYLKYQSRRPEYIDAFWHVVNWDQVNTIYQSLQ